MEQQPIGRKAGRENVSTSGSETRRRLILAGLEVFSRHGYEAATTRMLAREAGANLAAIPYHFGSKEGLYHAVIEHIVESLRGGMGPVGQSVAATLAKEKASETELMEALASFVRALAGQLIATGGIGEKAGPIIMAEQLHPSAAFDRLYTAQMEPLHTLVARLVARLEGIPEDVPAAKIRAHTILGQILSFRMAREAALRRLRWKTFDQREVEQICEVVVENCRRMLFSAGGRKGP